MNIRSKLLLASVSGFSSYMLILLFVWMPVQLDTAKMDFILNQKMVLDAIEPDVARNILARDYAALYSSLDKLSLDNSW
jgi:hypothetical protein